MIFFLYFYFVQICINGCILFHFFKTHKASEKTCSFGICIYIFGECIIKKKCDSYHILFVRKEDKDEREFWEGGDMGSPMTDS